MSANVQKINDMLAASIEAMGYELWAVRLTSDPRKTLCVLVDGPEGIGMDACGEVSRQVAAILDVENPISGHYTLEVSSPGMGRPLITLSHFERYIGCDIKVKLRVPLEERRVFRGKLLAVNAEQLELALEDTSVCLDMQAIDKANLIPNFS